MPVTAKLSRKFYETLGDDIANELVEWWANGPILFKDSPTSPSARYNVVDATYRSDLRELNDLNFARFDSRLGQRVAESEARLDRRMGEVETRLNQRMNELDSRLTHRMAELEIKLSQRMTDLETRMEAGFERSRSEMIKWSFLFWMGMVVTVFVSRFIQP